MEYLYSFRHSFYRRRCQDKPLLYTRFSCIGRPNSDLSGSVHRSPRGVGESMLFRNNASEPTAWMQSVRGD